MKHFYSICVPVFVFVLLSACSKDDSLIDNEGIKTSRATTDEIYYANQFAKDVLADFYVWNKEISADLIKLNPDVNTDPVATVKDIRYKVNGKEVDKWTVLTNDYEGMTEGMSGVETTYGYSLKLGSFSNTGDYFFLVAFVYEGSPAEKAGIKRGDIIVQLNGKDITKDNYGDVLNTSGITLRMGIDKGTSIELGKTIQLTAIKMYLNPILVVKTFDCAGKKVGYLAYSQFDLVSIPKLIELCKNFKAEGVTELILDLRYNGGGYVITENALASMFAPESEVKAKGLYQKEIWNDEYMDYFKQKGRDTNTYFTTSFIIQDENKNTSKVSTEGANIGLKKIYGLITSGSASASESLLIGLMPFMDVELIGTTSQGKYCTGRVLAPQDIYKTPPTALKNWGIYVMINRYTDKNGNNPCMPDGLIPQYTLRDDIMDGYQLGDERETMLKAALIKAGKTDIPTTRASRSVSLPEYQLEDIHTSPLYGKRILDDDTYRAMVRP